MDVNGWILIGFPKTLAQAKLLEKALSGYEIKSDLPKSKI
jgi:adenylate kinase family enzyme